MAQIIVRHGEDGLVIRHVADDTGHIPIPGQFAGLLAAVACHDLITTFLAGADQGGLVYAASLDTLHQGLHLRVIPHLEGVILKGVEFGQIKIDNLLLDRAGGVPWFGGLFR